MRLLQSSDVFDALNYQIKLLGKVSETRTAEEEIIYRGATLKDTKDRLENVDAIFKQIEAQQKLDGLQMSPDAPGVGGMFGGKYGEGKFKSPRGGYGNVLTKEQNDAIFAPPPPGMWKQFKSVASDALSSVTTAGQIMGDSLGAVFSGLAQGAGQMVEAFLLGGDLSAGAFAKMAKAAIASAAAQALVNAIFEEAMGLASLGLNPAAAAGHFLAAKTFALVGVAAGAVSLAIPGGSSGASAGVSAATSGFGSVSGSQGGSQDRTVREARTGGSTNPYTPQNLTAHITLNIDGKKFDHVVATLLTKPTKTRDEANRLIGYAPA
jgi:hypothetical protein